MITMGNSGQATSPITFAAYGDQALPNPIIKGSVPITNSWSVYSNNISLLIIPIIKYYWIGSFRSFDFRHPSSPILCYCIDYAEIYKASFPSVGVTNLFVGGQLMTLARQPNAVRRFFRNYALCSWCVCCRDHGSGQEQLIKPSSLSIPPISPQVFKMLMWDETNTLQEPMASTKELLYVCVLLIGGTDNYLCICFNDCSQLWNIPCHRVYY